MLVTYCKINSTLKYMGQNSWYLMFKTVYQTACGIFGSNI